MRISRRCKAFSFLRAALALLAAALFAVLPLAGCSDSDAEKRQLFDAGVRAFNSGDFDEARRCFISSDHYAEADSYLEAIAGYEDLYLRGVAAFEAKDYASAGSCFAGVRNYLNSKDYLERIDKLREQYEVGRLLYDEGQFLPARAAFIAADGYEQSAAYLENIDSMVGLYNRGVELMNTGNCMDALTTFLAINTEFEDSAELIGLCRSRLTVSRTSLNAYIKNYNEGYGGEVKIDAGNLDSDFSLRDSRGVLFSGTTDENGMITRIGFGFTAEVRESLGEEGMTAALCHCINALNPYIADLPAVQDGLFAYLSRTGAGYGAMWVRSVDAGSGALLIEAQFFSGIN